MAKVRVGERTKFSSRIGCLLTGWMVGEYCASLMGLSVRP